MCGSYAACRPQELAESTRVIVVLCDRITKVNSYAILAVRPATSSAAVERRFPSGVTVNLTDMFVSIG